MLTKKFLKFYGTLKAHYYIFQSPAIGQYSESDNTFLNIRSPNRQGSVGHSSFQEHVMYILTTSHVNTNMYVNFCTLTRFLSELDISMSQHAGSLSLSELPICASGPGCRS
jgi:hypothetical protein